MFLKRMNLGSAGQEFNCEFLPLSGTPRDFELSTTLFRISSVWSSRSSDFTLRSNQSKNNYDEREVALYVMLCSLTSGVLIADHGTNLKITMRHCMSCCVHMTTGVLEPM